MTTTRTVEVRPPAEGETAAVARAALLIVALCWLGLRAGAQASAPRERLLLAHQQAFEALHDREWRLCNEGLVALREICALRGESGRWPEPRELTEEEIVPFAPLVDTAGELRFSWRLEQRAGVTSYLGRPEGKGPRLLLQLQPAAPGAAGHQVAADARHVRLDDGTLVHHALWLGRKGAKTEGGAPLRPEFRGWTQVLVTR